MTTYTADTKPGQGISFPDLKMHKGHNGRVKLGDKVLCSSGLFGTQAAAQRWAVAKAKEYRLYRQEHGEGKEDAQDRKRAADKAEMRQRERRRSKGGAIYELLQLLASDAELVREWLPKQALGRLDQVRELVAFIETDPPSPAPKIDPTTSLGALGPLP